MSKPMSQRVQQALQSLVLTLVNLQSLIGLALIFCGLSLLWRPAGAMLVVGLLLALEEIVSGVRGKGG